MSAQDYSIFIAKPSYQARASSFRLVIVSMGAILRECFRRYRLSKMLELDATRLCDCGLDRGELISALNAPLNENATKRLSESRAARAKGN